MSSSVPDLRIGLVGYGSWTREAYIPALRRSGRASVVAAAARSALTRQRIRDELGNSLPVFDGIEALLGGATLDAVMIAVPDTMHEAVLSAALAAGVPALYEPPLSHTRGHLPQMIARLLSASQVTHADLELAYIPAVTRAAELLQAGALGKMETIGMCLQASWQAEAENDLSTVGRLTPWYVDVLNAIVGATPRRVFVLDGRGNSGRAQNFSCAHFDYGAVCGSFEVNLASLGELTVTVEARGTDGELALNLFSGEVRFRSRRNPDWTVESWPAQAPYAGWPGMHESVASFLESVAKGTPGPNGALKMAQLNQVALAAEEAKDTGTWANVEQVAADIGPRPSP
jgi:predicted dehydrogenase